MSSILFHEIQFPVDIAYGATGGPEFFTDVVTSSSGFEQRNINWYSARNRYNLAPAIKNKEQLDYLLGFFRLCQGRAIGFRFKDWLDYKIDNQQIAVANGEIKDFQIIKNYRYGSYTATRKIYKPIIDTIKVYANDELVEPIVNSSNGIISFPEAPAKDVVIRVEGEFDVAVRFDTDHLSASIENYGVYSHQEIPLIEVKL
ncbi:MAG: DUF2460 domain-containing protein [Rickettsiales bacterium]|jgi:uncharacterized protein (TIGR02217 family)|nr:DUF2460 domain-containing protein [Rickettsiales bacterium]